MWRFKNFGLGSLKSGFSNEGRVGLEAIRDSDRARKKDQGYRLNKDGKGRRGRAGGGGWG